MNRQFRFALSMTTLLTGAALLASCSTKPPPGPVPVPQPEPAPVFDSRSESVVAVDEIWVIAKPELTPAPALDDFEGGIVEQGGFVEEIVVTATARERPQRTIRSSRPSVDETPLDPGSGAMVASVPSEADAGGTKRVPLPLRHTAVDAAIAGHIGTVQVKQQFANPFDTKIEAVYVFPLPEKAAVTEFLMVIGDRTIRGILREKEEAEAIYREARV